MEEGLELCSAEAQAASFPACLGRDKYPYGERDVFLGVYFGIIRPSFSKCVI